MGPMKIQPLREGGYYTPCSVPEALAGHCRSGGTASRVRAEPHTTQVQTPGCQSAGSSRASRRKLTGRNPSLQEIMADFGFFIQPS